MNPTCHSCSRPIHGRCLLIRRQHPICTTCGSTTAPPLHHLTAPTCTVPWHDMWDHPNHIIITTSAALRALTTADPITYHPCERNDL